MTRCEIVQRYDANDDGTMDMNEFFNAIDGTGTSITPGELEWVKDAYVAGEGGVTQMCPAPSYDDDAKRIFKVFAVAGIIIYVFVKLLWK